MPDARLVLEEWEPLGLLQGTCLGACWSVGSERLSAAGFLGVLVGF